MWSLWQRWWENLENPPLRWDSTPPTHFPEYNVPEDVITILDHIRNPVTLTIERILLDIWNSVSKWWVILKQTGRAHGFSLVEEAVSVHPCGAVKSYRTGVKLDQSPGTSCLFEPAVGHRQSGGAVWSQAVTKNCKWLRSVTLFH